MPPGITSRVPAGIERVIGRRWTELADLTHPWATTRTVLVATNGWPAGTGRFVVQWGSDPTAIARRLRLGRRLADVAPRLPIPRIVGGDPSAPVPFLVSTFVEGRGGQALLDSDDDAETLGRLAGEISREVAAVNPAGLRLPRRWADPDRLQRTVGGWAERARSDLPRPVLERLIDLADHLPELVGGALPVFAHGDLAPVNIVIGQGRVTGLLDLERARLAHPLHDAAWWSATIGIHHPDRVDSAVGAFLESAGIPQDTATLARLRCLAACQALEVIAGLPVSAHASRRDWSARLAGILDGSVRVAPRR